MLWQKCWQQLCDTSASNSAETLMPVMTPVLAMMPHCHCYQLHHDTSSDTDIGNNAMTPMLTKRLPRKCHNADTDSIVTEIVFYDNVNVMLYTSLLLMADVNAKM